ncbi:MAG: hypothetical protein HKO95_04755 [Rhodobacteraceae bacterium]|nr:hypothetical protein [Paracoccaceae bacterium]
MENELKDFGTAKFVLALVQLFGWLVVAFAAIAGIFMAQEDLVLGIIYAGASALTGIITVAIGQIGIAMIATAENTSSMLELMKQTKPVVSGGKVVDETPFSSETLAEPEPNQPKPGDIIEEYRGYTIVAAANGVNAMGQLWYDVRQAKKAIDRQG